MPTHIKHNSSKISDRSQKFAIDQFYTVQFLEKFAIICEISKEFFAIDLFIYCSLMYIFCTVNFPINRKNSFKILRSIAIFSRNCTQNKLIDCKNSSEISRSIANFSRNCSVKTDRSQKNSFEFSLSIASFSRNCTVNKPINR